MREKVKKWYEQGLWTEDMVRRAQEKGVLTEAQVAEILGDVERSASSNTKRLDKLEESTEAIADL